MIFSQVLPSQVEKKLALAETRRRQHELSRTLSLSEANRWWRIKVTELSWSFYRNTQQRQIAVIILLKEGHWPTQTESEEAWGDLWGSCAGWNNHLQNNKYKTRWRPISDFDLLCRRSSERLRGNWSRQRSWGGIWRAAQGQPYHNNHHHDDDNSDDNDDDGNKVGEGYGGWQ